MPRVVILLLVVSAAACGRSAVSPDPASSGSPALSSTSTGASSAANSPKGRSDVTVSMMDACDPATFNAMFGDGTCIRSGGVTLDQFIAQLTKFGSIGAWHFAPPTANVRVGQTFVATNKGGEVHTFTEVAQFGGGIIDQLNQITHAGATTPECAALEGDDFVPPGGTYTESVDHTGTLKFQCCIHPWMRLEATASSK
jgi:plastocyanin